MGVMAQDFYAAFGIGEDERHITTIDADGVAFAAIQGLNEKLETENAALEVLSLPVHAGLSAADLETIVGAVNEFTSIN
jgi:dTDP-4-amino-4,6-dideoxygalactose transaminase